MIERIIIAGFGGQGIILMGKVLAQAALKENRQVTFLPAYGAEVRGGTAHCIVVISDCEIASPFVNEIDTLIIMNEPSWAKFKHRLKDKALLIVNTSLVNAKDIKLGNALALPFSDIASRLGNIKIANMVALGVFLAKKKIVSSSSVFEVMEEIAPEDKRGLIEINKQAIREGIGLVK